MPPERPANRWALIYNPRAGGFSQGRLEALQAALHAAGVRVSPFATRAPGDATLLMQRLQTPRAASPGAQARAAPANRGPGARRFARIAVLGGDGVLNEAAQGALGGAIPLVFLPAGTANVMAHELGLPREARSLAHRAVQAQPRRVRPGMLDGRCFLLMAGVGFDAAAIWRTPLGLKKRLGKAAYVWGGLRALAAARPALRIRAGHWEATGVWLVAARARHYAGRFVLCPQAGLEQPALQALLATPPGLFLALGGRLALGLKCPLRGLQEQAVEALQITSSQPVPAHVDGEPLPPRQRFAITLSPQELWLCR